LQNKKYKCPAQKPWVSKITCQQGVQILIVTVTVKIHTESTLQEDSNIFNPNYICHLVEE